jgi:hypothetical protein
MLHGHESHPHRHDMVLRSAVTLQVCTHLNAYRDILHNSRTADESDIRDQNILTNGSYELHCVLVLKKLIIFVIVTKKLQTLFHIKLVSTVEPS